MGLFDGFLGHGSTVDPADLDKRIDGVLIDGEQPQLAFKLIRWQARSFPSLWRAAWTIRSSASPPISICAHQAHLAGGFLLRRPSSMIMPCVSPNRPAQPIVNCYLTLT